MDPLDGCSGPSATARAATLLVGGTAMVLGSIWPWTREMLHGPGFTFYRNGLHLGVNRSFSLAGLFTLIFGARAILRGAVRLADKRAPRLIEVLPVLDGLVGVGVGLFGLGAAAWYVRQFNGQGGLFIVTAGYGIWTVVVGGTSVLLADAYPFLFRQRRRRGVLAAIGLVCLVGLSAAAIAPK